MKLGPVTPLRYEDLAAANLGVLIGPCAHNGAVPVDLLLTGETVAWLCPECDAQLPAGWR